jgi:hypothetical protein
MVPSAPRDPRPPQRLTSQLHTGLPPSADLLIKQVKGVGRGFPNSATTGCACYCTARSRGRITRPRDCGAPHAWWRRATKPGRPTSPTTGSPTPPTPRSSPGSTTTPATPARVRLAPRHRTDRPRHLPRRGRRPRHPASTLTDNGMVFTTRLAGGKGGRNALEAEPRRLHVAQKNASPATPRPAARWSDSSRR